VSAIIDPSSKKDPIPSWLSDIAVIPGEFPIERMREVWDRGEEIEDALVGYLEWLASEDQPGWEMPPNDWLHFIAFYLLSDRASASLFDPLVAIVSDEEYGEFLLGESISEDLSSWLRVSGGNRTEDLRKIVENTGVSGSIRMAALGALGGMAWEETISRQEYEDYLRLLPDRTPTDSGLLWCEWQAQVTDFGLEDLIGRIVELDQRGVFLFSGSAEEILEEMRDPEREKRAESSLLYKRPGGTAGLEEFAKFPCFEPGYHESRTERAAALARELLDDPYGLPPVPIVREEPKIGRNDPCPCGSGKKWKKCCGSISAEG